MMTYNVIVSDAALADLDSIFYHIAFNLESPQTAVNQLNRIEEKIYSLDTLPKRCKVFSKTIYPGCDLRRLLVDNYSILYYIDGTEVNIANVVYSWRTLRHIK